MEVYRKAREHFDRGRYATSRFLPRLTRPKSLEAIALPHYTGSACRAEETDSFCERDRRFESCFLQRRSHRRRVPRRRLDHRTRLDIYLVPRGELPRLMPASCRGPEGLISACYWSRPTAFEGTSNAASVSETPVNQPRSIVTSTIPASPSSAFARR